MTDRQEAVDLVYNNLGSLPDPEFGVLNIMPFTVDSDQTNAMKRRVAEAIVDLFASNGFLRDRTEEASPRPTRDVSVSCRLCSAELMRLRVDNGVANVPAATVLSAMARMTPECPHDVLTPDDQRRKIEEAVKASQQ